MPEIIYNLQKTKSLYSTKYRIIYAGAFYHLIQRAPGNERLFFSDEDYLFMLSLMKETSKKFSWKFFSFVLMPNHIHNLIQITEENLSQGAKFLFETYAKNFNKRYNRKGPVFCRPYRAFLCLNDSYLLAISIYIHLNPYKAGLVDDPLKYKWSSIKLFTENRNPITFIDYNFILSMLHNRRDRAREIYKKLLKETGGIEFEDIVEKPNFIRKFCLETIKLKNLIGKGWNLEREVEKFKKMRCKKSITERRERRKLISNLIKQGYSVSETAQILNLSRQQIYRLLKDVT